MSDVSSGAPAPAASPAEQQLAEMGGSDVVETTGDEGFDLETEEAELESAEEIEAAAKAGEISKKEAQVLKKKLKIKVDGEESEVDLDWNDEESLRREIQKARAFDKRTKEHSTYKSQVEQALEIAKNDPERFLEMLGHNVDEFSEKRLSKKIEELKKSPQELEAEKMRKELEDYKKKEKESSERAKQAELEKMKNEQAAQIENDISSALDDAKSFLPKRNPDVYRRIAQTMLLAMQQGYTNVTAKEVIPLVEKQYKAEVAALLGSAPDDVLESLATKERLTSYRKAQVSQKKVQSPSKPKVQDTGTRREKEQKQPEPFHMKSLLSIRPK